MSAINLKIQLLNFEEVMFYCTLNVIFKKANNSRPNTRIVILYKNFCIKQCV